MNLRDLSENSLRYHLETLVNECINHGISFKDALEQMEMEFIMQILASCNYNVSKSADKLEINRNTLSRKIERYEQFEKFRQHRHIHNSGK